MNLYYKYLPSDRLSYLKDELLRYTQPLDLNDPFECLPKKPSEEEFKKLIESILPYFPKTSIPLKDISGGLNLNTIYNDLYQNVNNDIGILSLTKKWNNTLMWAHYSISHKGFCIGFDPNHEYFTNFLSSNGDKSKTVLDVIYSEERVELPMELGKKKLGFEPYITKSKDWDYEEEVRVIASLNMSDKQRKGVGPDIHLFIVPHKAIKEIIAGANMDENNEKLIKEFCSKNNIQFYKSRISNVHFNMERD